MRQYKWKYIFPVVTVILLVSLMLTIYNRFIPIQEGWMQYYSLLTQKGFLPYKDFYYFTQPIPLFIVELISKFSGGYIYFRYYGMVERVILVVALYFLLAKHFSQSATFIAVIASSFLYQSFNVDILYTYYQTTLLFFLLSLICLQRGADSRHSWLYNIFVGIFASLAFFTKQSSGLFVSLFLLFMMIWLTPKKLMLRRVACFLLGWAIPASLIIGWLVKKQIFFDYLNQVFGGTSSKGSPINILFGFWTRNHALLYLGLFLFGLLIIFFLWKKKSLNITIESDSISQPNQIIYLLFFSFPIFLASGFLLQLNKNLAGFVWLAGDYYDWLWLYFSFYLLTITTIIIGTKWISRKPLPFSRPLAELVIASFVWTYSSGLSGQLDIPVCLLGTALVLAFLFDRVQINWKYFRFFLITLTCLLVFICAAKKIQKPNDWWGWTEFGHSESAESIIPAFKGFNLSPETVRIYDGIYLDIVNNTTSSDYVYTYPFITMFNYVTDRLQPTFSPIGYFDVCPDNIAVMDAAKLIKNPPKMIVYMEMPAWVYKFHEDLFRNGQPSGQRKIDAAIKEIVQKYNYKNIDSFLSVGWDWPIYVWLKP